MQNVAEIIGESFEEAMNTGKRSDSFNSALTLMSIGGRTDKRISKVLNAIANHEDKEGMMELFTSYFRGDTSFTAIEKSLGTTGW